MSRVRSPRDGSHRGFGYGLASRQAVADMRAMPVRTAIQACVSLLVGALVVIMAFDDVGRIVAQRDELVAAGRYVYVAAREDRGPMDAAECDALRSVPGVRGAGGVIRTGLGTPITDSSVVLLQAAVTPGLIGVVWPDVVAGGATPTVAASGRLGTDLGLVPGSTLVWNAVNDMDEVRAMTIQAVAGTSHRFDQFSSAVLVSEAPRGSVSDCYIEADPAAFDAVGGVLAGWFSADAPVIVSPWWTAPNLGLSPEEQLDERRSAMLPLAGASVLALVSVSFWTARRSDVALYRLLGMRATRLAVLVGADFASSYLLPMSAGVFLGQMLAGSGASGVATAAAIDDAARLATLSALVPLVAIGLLSLVKPLDALKGR